MKKAILTAICTCLMTISMISALNVVSIASGASEKKAGFFDIHSLKIEPPLRRPNEKNSTGSQQSELSTSGFVPPVSPYPQDDELTDNAHRETVGLQEYLYIDYILADYWVEGTNPGNTIFVASNGSADKYIYDIANYDHHYLAFCFDSQVDLTSCTFIKYYQGLGEYGNSGSCSIVFYEFNGTQPYLAGLSYTVAPDGLFYRQMFNVSQRSSWTIDPGFDWSKVDGFLFGAEMTQPGALMVIDKPKLYFNFSDPLPVNKQIDEAEGNATRIRILSELWHGEISGGYESWLLKIYLEDTGYLADPGIYDHPSYVTVDVILPENAEEHEPDHWPQAGYVGSARISTGLSYGSIGFSVASAEKYISYSRKKEVGKTIIEWQVTPSMFWGSVSGCVFHDYCQFVVGFRTSLGSKPWAYIGTEVKIYGPTMPADWWPDWTERLDEDIGWLYLDPPGSTPATPGTNEPINASATLERVAFNEVKTLDRPYGIEKTDFQRGSSLWLYTNRSWWVNNTKDGIDIRIYDSQGTMISMAGFKSWTSGDYISRGDKELGAGLFIPNYAALGEAKIVVRILCDWPEVDSREFARQELNITISG